MRPTVPRIIETSIVSAFTIAAVLIWKDVIVEAIDLLVPHGDTLMYKFIVAVFSTVVVIIAIYVILNTEKRAEMTLRNFRNNHIQNHTPKHKR